MLMRCNKKCNQTKASKLKKKKLDEDVGTAEQLI